MTIVTVVLMGAAALVVLAVAYSGIMSAKRNQHPLVELASRKTRSFRKNILAGRAFDGDEEDDGTGYYG